MKVEEYGLFRKGQKIHVAVRVANDSRADGGWAVAEDKGSGCRKYVMEKRRLENWVEIIPEMLRKQG